MLELSATRVSVVGCFAAPEALDALAAAHDAHVCRVAPDEVMLVGEPDAAATLVAAAIADATAIDPDAVVLDTTGGWAIWSLAGDAAREAFARLSAVELPDEGSTQGDVAHVPVRVIALPDRLHLVVPAMWREHLRERILARCASLGVEEVTALAASCAAPRSCVGRSRSCATTSW